MPTESRYFLKFGLIYFVCAMVCGVAMSWLGGSWGAVLLPTYLHLFVVGWISQIIIGVALWLFPKWTKEQPRGREWMSWVALVTLNLGLLLRVACEPLHTLGHMEAAQLRWLGWGLVASALLQWVGGISFMLNIWGRIKPKKTRSRDKKTAAPRKAAAPKAAGKAVDKADKKDKSEASPKTTGGDS